MVGVKQRDNFDMQPTARRAAADTGDERSNMEFLVGGEVVLDHGQHSGALPGQVLRARR